MSIWLVIAVVLVVLLLLAVGGAIAQRRRLDQGSGRFHAHLEQANLDLAAAHAQDRGWERGALERAAGEALAEHEPDTRARSLTLVQVLDRPGTDDDRAVFRVELEGGGERTLTLVRHGGRWVSEGLSG